MINIKVPEMTDEATVDKIRTTLIAMSARFDIYPDDQVISMRGCGGSLYAVLDTLEEMGMHPVVQ